MPSYHSRPQYRPDAIGNWASRYEARLPIRPALRGFTFVRCCSLPRASIPRVLTAKAPDTLGTSRSCLRLMVASNRPHRGLSPPSIYPCLAHSGSVPSPPLRSQNQIRFKRLKLNLQKEGYTPELYKVLCSIGNLLSLGDHSQQIVNPAQHLYYPLSRQVTVDRWNKRYFSHPPGQGCPLRSKTRFYAKGIYQNRGLYFLSAGSGPELEGCRSNGFQQ